MEQIVARERILNVAQDLFARNDFKKVTFREIAKHARIAFTLITYHFGTKERLYDAVIETLGAEIDADLRVMRASKSNPADRLREFAVLIYQFACKYPAISMVYLNDQAQPSAQNETMRKLSTAGIKFLHDTIQEGIKTGAFKKVSSIENARIQYAAILYYFFMRDQKVNSLPSFTADYKKYLDQAMDIFLNGLAK
ncbi:MAG: TetR/AcrR family transcriptional regulator [Negativicutes bacterium]